METNSPAGPVSVIVPVKNEAATVHGLLRSLLDQTTPPREILVVDAGSSDGTRDIVKGVAEGGHPVRLLVKDGAYPGVARNFGAEHASTTWLAFIDAGVHVGGEWLETLLLCRRQNPAADVVYSNYAPLQDTFFRKAYFIAYGSPTTIVPGKQVRTHGAILLVRKEAWERVGGYPAYRASEDREFVSRLRSAGFREAWSADAVAIWEPPPTFAAAFRKSLSYGYHDVLAGKARDWHFGVVRAHVLLLALAFAGAAVTPWAWSLVPAGLVARIGKRFALKRRESGFRGFELVPGLLCALATLLASDVAALASGAYFVFEHKIKRRPNPYQKTVTT